MTARSFRLSTMITAVVLGAVMSISLIADLPLWIPLSVILVAVVLKFYLRKKTTEAIVDERLKLLGNRAMAISVKVFILIMAIFEMVVVVMHDTIPYELAIVGTTLAYAAGIMVLVYTVCYYWLAARS